MAYVDLALKLSYVFVRSAAHTMEFKASRAVRFYPDQYLALKRKSFPLSLLTKTRKSPAQLY